MTGEIPQQNSQLKNALLILQGEVQVLLFVDIQARNLNHTWV